MKELNRTDRLTIASILFAIILIIGLVTYKQPEIRYTRSIDETIYLLGPSTDYISPAEAITSYKNNPASTPLIDLRSPLEFQKAHIEGAINIPLEEILEKQKLKIFRDKNKTFVLYGKDQTEASSVWLVLKQTGIDNIRIMEGGYDSFEPFVGDKGIVTAEKNFNSDKPAYDYKAILNDFGPSALSPATSSPEPVKMIRKEKKSAAEGGC